MDISSDVALNTFRFHGIDIPKDDRGKTILNQSGQAVIQTCPFCSDSRSIFFISAREKNAGQFNCKKCGLEGNRYTFLQLRYEQYLAETEDCHYKELRALRKTKHWQAFRNDQWAYDSEMDRWIVPIKNATGSFVNLKVYTGPDSGKAKWQNTTGCSQHFYGLDELHKEGLVYIVEGEADRSMLKYIFPIVMDDRPFSVIGVPGKDLFNACAKKLKGTPFANRDCVLLYDAGKDPANRMKKAADLLSREYHARSVLCINWPESFPDNRDISDLIDTEGESVAWAQIQSWLLPHNHKPLSTVLGGKEITFNMIISEFRKSGIHVNQSFSDALMVILATIISVLYGGIPLWTYLVGRPGIGKSLILESTIKSILCLYQTDLKYQTLVSGFKADPDPSLMAHLQNRVLVIKDYTTIMEKNEIAQKELLGLLRDGYDGEIDRTFGNGVRRIYPDPASGHDRCFFGIIAGVTPKIHVYNKAALGERFLKWELGKSGVSDREAIRLAIEGSNEPWQEIGKANRRQEIVSQFLEQLKFVEKPPSVRKYSEQIAALSQFAAVARTRPERDHKSGDLLYSADPESATRISKQLTKLAQSISVVRGLGTIDGESMRLVKKAAWFTGYGWSRDVYAALWRLRERPATLKEISVESKKALSSTQKIMADLRDLNIAERIGKRLPSQVSKKGGQPADLFQLTEHGTELIVTSKLFSK